MAAAVVIGSIWESSDRVRWRVVRKVENKVMLEVIDDEYFQAKKLSFSKLFQPAVVVLENELLKLEQAGRWKRVFPGLRITRVMPVAELPAVRPKKKKAGKQAVKRIKSSRLKSEK